MTLRPVLGVALAALATAAAPSFAQPAPPTADALECVARWATRPAVARPLVTRDGLDVTIHGNNVVYAANYEIDAAQALVACLLA